MGIFIITDNLFNASSPSKRVHKTSDIIFTVQVKSAYTNPAVSCSRKGAMSGIYCWDKNIANVPFEIMTVELKKNS